VTPIINFILGPLLWHWENNSTNDPSVELDMEELKTLARQIGFEISVSLSDHAYTYLLILILSIPQNETTIDTTYTNNAQSMLGYVYHAAFWTATKIE